MFLDFLSIYIYILIYTVYRKNIYILHLSIRCIPIRDRTDEHGPGA